ncbi:MAG: hypothetical protein IPK17_04660 [Chloroflexi bacterium]|uniref:hypothetical protein n=1 Tax=Candidatus Flexifilum breve TaxID=3140694 RepID=UPI0031363CC4|nr:hypothetical protein [Chloroflexota bacterium]
MSHAYPKMKLALLLAIRELQPVSYKDLLELVKRTDPRLPVNCRPHLPFAQFNRVGLHYIHELITAGLVQTENGDRLESNTLIRATPALSVIQDLFRLSLNELLLKPEDTIEMSPLFGRPLGQNTVHQWARIFVAMPFLDELLPVYRDHIAQVAGRLHVSCKRGDDFATTNSIIQEVWSAIYHADLLIVDCTHKNPNVFYELGVAHTLGKKAVLIAQSREDFPFDVQHLRSIVYSTDPAGMKRFEALLEKTLRTELELELKTRVPPSPFPGETP